jgi:hypothetical protein
MRQLYLIFLVPLLLWGCAQFPEMDQAERQSGGAGVALPLVPLEGLLDLAEPGRATGASRDSLEARADGLRARARALRGSG